MEEFTVTFSVEYVIDRSVIHTVLQDHGYDDVEMTESLMRDFVRKTAERRLVDDIFNCFFVENCSPFDKLFTVNVQ